MAQSEVTTTTDGRRLTLAPVLDILAAERLRDLLRESAILGGRLEIDAGGVERMSTPCVQVLLAAAAAFAAAGIPFVVRRPSEAFMNAMYELGLFDAVAAWDIEQ